MDIVIATNNEFCQHAAVTIVSIYRNNNVSDITIHLFTIECNNDNIEHIKKTVHSFNGRIIIHDITSDIFKNFPPTGKYSIASYLRLLVASLLPNIDKVLYLDCDLIVKGSLDELWNTDISNYSIAAVNDTIISYSIVKDYIGYDYNDGYFNSGVLLINLQYWRNNNIEKKLINYLNTHTVKLPDQDALNIILHGSVKYINPKWNCHVGFFAFPPLVIQSQKKYIKYLWGNAKIVHFTGPYKPWVKECINPYKKYYWQYILDTPWKGFKIISKCDNKIRSYSIIIFKILKINFSKIISYFYY